MTKILDCANFAGAVAGAFFFTYLTDVFEHEPWLTGVRNIIITKTEKVIFNFVCFILLIL